MLVLVGVTINVALTGGLFEKGEKAAYQTNAATVKEQVALKVAEELADNGGKALAGGYTITIEQLQLSQALIVALDDALQAESVAEAIHSLQGLAEQWN